jgi:beta-lactamase regulating signal transducer with metallopeptidase domain
MTIGGSLFLIAVGAILRYATNLHVQGINIDTVGLILMIVGIVGFVIGLIYELAVVRDRSRYYKYWGRNRDAAAPPPADPQAPTRRYYE